MGMIDRDRLGLVSGALMVALALVRLLDGPGRPLQLSVLGSPLGINLSATTLMLLIGVGLAITGVESLLRHHSLAPQRELERSVVFWILPALWTLALGGWLSRIDELGLWAVVLAGAAVLIPLVLLVEYVAASPPQTVGAGLLPWGQMILAHLAALLLFFLIYDAGLRSLLAGPAVMLLGTLLAARLFWDLTGRAIAPAFRYGVLVGLVLGLLTWFLDVVWPLSALRGALLLLLAFYVLVGLIQQYLTGRFGREVLLEYGAVSLVALLLVLFVVP